MILVSLQSAFTVLIMFAKPEIEPDVLSKAATSGK